MASFAKLNTNNQVIGVIIVNDDDIKDNNGVPAEGIGVGFLQKNYGADMVIRNPQNIYFILNEVIDAEYEEI